MLAFGVLFYSSTLRRLRDGRRRNFRHILNGLAFGALAVWLPLTLAIVATHYLGMKHWAFAERR